MKNILKYNGYFGSIEGSPEDDCLFGELLFIRALVTYEGQTVRELDQAFREAVDDYLETCKAQGVEPETPLKGSFNVRVGPRRHQRAMLAVQQHQIKSLNELVNQAIDHELERLEAC
jgi:predicted HicB family RNase H-like nuclease